MKYDWPETDALVAFVKKHGITLAATKLGCPPSSLRDRLRREGISPEDYRPAPATLNADALKELYSLVS